MAPFPSLGSALNIFSPNKRHAQPRSASVVARSSPSRSRQDRSSSHSAARRSRSSRSDSEKENSDRVRDSRIDKSPIARRRRNWLSGFFRSTTNEADPGPEENTLVAGTEVVSGSEDDVDPGPEEHTLIANTEAISGNGDEADPGPEENTPPADAEAMSSNEDESAGSHNEYDATSDHLEEDPDLSLDNIIFDPDDERVRDWAAEEIWVHNRLATRDLEPNLPHSWLADFPTFPEQFFTRHSARTFINNLHTPVSEATTAFNGLIQAGPNCRSQILSSRNPETAINRALSTFHKWALRDGNLRRRRTFTPILSTVIARPNEAADAVFSRCEQRLYKYGRQWTRKLASLDEEDEEEQTKGASRRGRGRRRRTSLLAENEAKESGASPRQQSNEVSKTKRRPPVLYAFVVKYSVLAIVSWDPSSPSPENIPPPVDAGKPVRVLGTYDWNEVGQDVWHALAVALVECKARDTLIEMAERRELGEVVIEDDPDL